MDNWNAEALRFTPGFRVKVWPARELDNLLQGLTEADLHVLNYSQLRTLGESLAPVRWHVVILDEGQYIKNPSSQTAQVARSLRAEHRLVLSGTPIENRFAGFVEPDGLYNAGGNRESRAICQALRCQGRSSRARRLSSRVRRFCFDGLKRRWRRICRIRSKRDLFCEIEGEQQTLYRAELKRAQQMLLAIKTQKGARTATVPLSYIPIAAAADLLSSTPGQYRNNGRPARRLKRCWSCLSP